jgi:uncharacterized membrane protein SpoIIM required for sporulation
MAKWLPVWIVARRELRDQLRDWRILLPLVILTLFFPFLMVFAATLAVNYVNRYGANLIAERIIPFFLLVVGFFPVTITLVIALETFVGEKERGTIEPLLCSPLLDWQLYLGKLFAGLFLPVMAIGVDILLFFGLVNWLDIQIPEVSMLILTAILSIAQAILMVSGAIVISTQATSVRGANLLVSFIIIPIGLLLQGESMLMFWGNDLTLWLTVLAVILITILIIRLGLAHFQREYLLGREIDILNLKWAWTTFGKAFRGKANSLGSWYRYEIGPLLRRMRSSVLVIVLIGIVCFFAAQIWVSAQDIPVNTSLADIGNALEASVINLPGEQITFWGILLNNLRAMLLIAALGLFSFGVLGTIAYLVNIALIGGVLGIISLAGVSPFLLFVSGILPHGIFEIPALILVCAMILHNGTVLVTPSPERTLGELFIFAVTDLLKIMVGVALPLFAIAAMIETWITPHIMGIVFR